MKPIRRMRLRWRSKVIAAMPTGSDARNVRRLQGLSILLLAVAFLVCPLQPTIAEDAEAAQPQRRAILTVSFPEPPGLAPAASLIKAAVGAFSLPVSLFEQRCDVGRYKMNPLARTTYFSIFALLLTLGMLSLVAVPARMSATTYVAASVLLITVVAITLNTLRNGQATGSIGQVIHEADVSDSRRER